MMKIEDTALVLEGGGLRGVFTCGVLDCFMDHGIRFPFAVEVSRMEKDTAKLSAYMMKAMKWLWRHCRR